MSDEGFVDPAEPDTGGDYLKAGDLRNQVVLLHPTGEGSQPGKPDPESGEVKPWEYVIVDAATLDRSGIVAFSPGVRISWTRPRSSLRKQVGQIVAGKFQQEEGGNAVELHTLTGEARKVAAEAVKDFEARIAGRTEGEPAAEEWDDGQEPF